MDQTVTAPVRVSFEAPLEVANWRPLVHWLLAIPHMMIMYFLNIAEGIITFIAFFAILFTKKYPEGLHRFMTMIFRYQWRTYSYMFFMRESYPPFDFTTEGDPAPDPAKVEIDYPQELNRWLPLIKWLLVIPHAIVLALLGIVAFFAWIGAFFAVLFTGKYPEGIRNYMVGLTRWVMRVSAYMYLLRDEYPPFSMQ